jgi:hypothetical protein
MRVISTMIGLALLAGCGHGAPNAFSGPAPEQAMGCATHQFEKLGYEESNAIANGGVRMERINDEPWYKEMLGFNDSLDVVNVSSSDGQLRVNVFTQVLGEGHGQRANVAPDDDSRSEASDIFAACT